MVQASKWRARCETVEVGCGGFVGQSLRMFGHHRDQKAEGHQGGQGDSRGGLILVVDQERRSVGGVALPGTQGGEFLMSEKPKTLISPDDITEDVSRLHYERMLCCSQFELLFSKAA